MDENYVQKKKRKKNIGSTQSFSSASWKETMLWYVYIENEREKKNNTEIISDLRENENKQEISKKKKRTHTHMYLRNNLFLHIIPFILDTNETSL